MVQDTICKLARFTSFEMGTCEEAFDRVSDVMRLGLEETAEKERRRRQDPWSARCRSDKVWGRIVNVGSAGLCRVPESEVGEVGSIR